MDHILDKKYTSASEPSVAIIIPFRDYNTLNNERTKQLNSIIPYLEKFMNNTIKKWKIFVIKQEYDGLKFNRGQLCNIGAIEAMKHSYDTLIFHDVDLLPSELLKDWYTKRPKRGYVFHIAKCWNTKYNFSKGNNLGGICSMRSDDFKKIGGYPNIYWGWGGEDDETVKRIIHVGAKIIGPYGKGLVEDLEKEKTYFEKKKNYFDIFTNIKNTFKHEINELHDKVRNSDVSKLDWWGYKQTEYSVPKWYVEHGTNNVTKCTYSINVIGTDIILNFKLEKDVMLTFNIKETASFDFMIDYNNAKSIIKSEIMQKINVKNLKKLIVNDCLTSMYKNGYMSGDNGSTFKFDYPLDIICGRYMYELIVQHKRHNTLEVGLGEGFGSLWMLQAHKDNKKGFHISIDPNQMTSYKGIGLYEIESCKLSNNFKFIGKPSHLVLPKILIDVQKGKIPKFDLIYIDGWHTFDYTLIDFFYSDQLLNIGGTIVIDDVRHAGVKKCVSYILQNYKHYKMIENKLETNIILVKVSEDSREWFFHKNF